MGRSGDVAVDGGVGIVDGGDGSVDTEPEAAEGLVDLDGGLAVAGPGHVQGAVGTDGRRRELVAALVADQDLVGPGLPLVPRRDAENIRVIEAGPDHVDAAPEERRSAVASDEFLVLEHVGHPVDGEAAILPGLAAVRAPVHEHAVALAGVAGVGQEHGEEVAVEVDRQGGIAVARVVRVDEEARIGPGRPVIEGVAPPHLPVAQPEVPPDRHQVGGVGGIDHDLLLVLQLEGPIVVDPEVGPALCRGPQGEDERDQQARGEDGKQTLHGGILLGWRAGGEAAFVRGAGETRPGDGVS